VREALPVILDVAGFVAIVAGTAVLFGLGWSLLAAGAALVLAGLRAQT